MLQVILQAKEAAQQVVGRCRNFPGAIVGNRGFDGRLPVRRAHVRREFEAESSGRVRPGNNDIGIVAQDSDRNDSDWLAVTPCVQKNGKCND